MTFLKEMCFVLDENGNRLSPTNKKKAGYLIRKGRAVQNNKFPMVIQLVRAIPGDMIDKTPIHLGIDDGSKHIGLALVQECKTKNKVVFKGTVEQRQDVKYLMDARRSYRQYKRSHKRYRKKRFRNRTSLKRKGRITPTIKQKREAALRTIKKLQSWCRIDVIHLEDVKIDVSSLVAGEKLYKWQYQKSTRLDENLRKATILRDNCTCQKCGKKKLSFRSASHHTETFKRCRFDSQFDHSM